MSERPMLEARLLMYKSGESGYAQVNLILKFKVVSVMILMGNDRVLL